MTKAPKAVGQHEVLNKGQPAWLRRIAAHPLLILNTAICSVVALVVMTVIFFISQTERKLVYAVNPVQTSVVTQGQVTGLESRYNGKVLGDVDVTATQVAIWNSGDKSIKTEHILRDVFIYT